MYVWVHLKNNHPIDTQLLDTQSLSPIRGLKVSDYQQFIFFGCFLWVHIQNFCIFAAVKYILYEDGQTNGEGYYRHHQREKI